MNIQKRILNIVAMLVLTVAGIISTGKTVYAGYNTYYRYHQEKNNSFSFLDKNYKISDYIGGFAENGFNYDIAKKHFT